MISKKEHIKRKEYQREYYKKNIERIKKRHKKWYREHFEEYKESKKAYNKKYEKQYPERSQFSSNRYWSRKRNSDVKGSFTFKQWQTKKKQYHYCCAYCGIIEKEAIRTQGYRLTIDHIVPPSRGGSDYISNIVPACKHCNSSKNADVWKPRHFDK